MWRYDDGPAAMIPERHVARCGAQISYASTVARQGARQMMARGLDAVVAQGDDLADELVAFTAELLAVPTVNGSVQQATQQPSE